LLTPFLAVAIPFLAAPSAAQVTDTQVVVLDSGPFSARYFKVFDGPSGALLATNSIPFLATIDFALTEDGSTMVEVGDGSIRFLDISGSTGTVRQTTTFGVGILPRALELSSTGYAIVSIVTPANASELISYDIASASEVSRISVPPHAFLRAAPSGSNLLIVGGGVNEPNMVRRIALAPDGTLSDTGQQVDFPSAWLNEPDFLAGADIAYVGRHQVFAGQSYIDTYDLSSGLAHVDTDSLPWIGSWPKVSPDDSRLVVFCSNPFELVQFPIDANGDLGSPTQINWGYIFASQYSDAFGTFSPDGTQLFVSQNGIVGVFETAGFTQTHSLTGLGGSVYPPVASLAGPYDHPPIADAGEDFAVFEGHSGATLDGSGSSDLDGDTLTLAWQQVSGPTVSLSSTSVAQPTFVAPRISTGFVRLTFELTVTSGGLSSVDTVSVTVMNRKLLRFDGNTPRDVSRTF